MKHAELQFSYLVSALLALLVLIVIIVIFHKQLSELLQPITQAIKEAVGLAGEIDLS